MIKWGVKMKLFYVMIIGLAVLVSACAQQTQPQAPPVPSTKPVAQPEAPESNMPVPEASETEEMEVVEDTKKASSGDEVRILGEGGFEPLEASIKSGSSVTWINDDEKTFTMTFFKDGRFFINSPVMKSGDRFEQAFNEPGEYEYWTLAYGPMGAKITVE
jgi:plastocyanin